MEMYRWIPDIFLVKKMKLTLYQVHMAILVVSSFNMQLNANCLIMQAIVFNLAKIGFIFMKETLIIFH